MFVWQVPQSELDVDTVKSILSEYRIHNADITLRYDATSDDLIDVIEGNRIYVPCIYLLNKIGMYTNEKLRMWLLPHVTSYISALRAYCTVFTWEVQFAGSLLNNLRHTTQ
jgi:ribosome-interacting GTPase 1